MRLRILQGNGQNAVPAGTGRTHSMTSSELTGRTSSSNLSMATSDSNANVTLEDDDYARFDLVPVPRQLTADHEHLAWQTAAYMLGKSPSPNYPAFARGVLEGLKLSRRGQTILPENRAAYVKYVFELVHSRFRGQPTQNHFNRKRNQMEIARELEREQLITKLRATSNKRQLRQILAGSGLETTKMQAFIEKYPEYSNLLANIRQNEYWPVEGRR